MISPTFAIRAGGVFQEADVEGRNYATDDRGGGFVAMTWKPVDAVKITADYVHTDNHGLPDFGVPYFRPGPTGSQRPAVRVHGRRPVSRSTASIATISTVSSTATSSRSHQDIATLNAEVQITPDLTLSDKIEGSESVLNYIGTIPESGHTLAAYTLTANPLSRYQPTDVVDNQSEATYKFDTGDWHHTAVAGVEVSRETSSIDSYTGLSSEGFGAGAFNSSGAPTNVSIINPQYTFRRSRRTPTLTGCPRKIAIDTTSGYLMDSANYRDLVILNGGVRLDDYGIKVSGFGTSSAVAGIFGAQAAQFDMPNFNLGITLKPLPITSVYACLRHVVGPGGLRIRRHQRQLRRHLAPIINGEFEPDIRADEEHGDRGRQQMGIVRAPFARQRRTVPDQCHQCARVGERHLAREPDRGMSL